jgi:hypothetical protein
MLMAVWRAEGWPIFARAFRRGITGVFFFGVRPASTTFGIIIVLQKDDSYPHGMV